LATFRVALISPAGRSTILHPQLGGPADNLIAAYDSTVLGSALSATVGQPMMGVWIECSDRANADFGKLRSWSIELTAAPT